MDKSLEYTPMEIAIAASWAQSNFTVWLQNNTSADPTARHDAFMGFFEGGLYIALEFCRTS